MKLVWFIFTIAIGFLLAALVCYVGFRPTVETADPSKPVDLLMDPKNSLTLLGLSAAALVYLAGVGMKLRETIRDARESLRGLTDDDPKRKTLVARVSRLSFRAVLLIVAEWLLFWLVILVVRVVLQAAHPTWVADLGISTPTSSADLASAGWWRGLHVGWPQTYKATVYLVLSLIVLTLLAFHTLQWGTAITAGLKWLFRIDRPQAEFRQRLMLISALPAEVAKIETLLAGGATITEFHPVKEASGAQSSFVVLLDRAKSP